MATHFLGIAEALVEAARLGIVHRDLKPANVLLDRYGIAHVADFGLVTATHAPSDHDTLVRSPHGSIAGLSVAGSVMGTLPYMSPEQLRGEPLDQRADVYGLGATIFHLLAGSPPINVRTADEALRQIQAGLVPVRQARPEVPRALATIVDRCLRADPAARFQSHQDLARAVRLAAPQPQVAPAPLVRLIAGLLDLLPAAGVFVALLREGALGRPGLVRALARPGHRASSAPPRASGSCASASGPRPTATFLRSAPPRRALLQWGWTAALALAYSLISHSAPVLAYGPLGVGGARLGSHRPPRHPPRRAPQAHARGSTHPNPGPGGRPMTSKTPLLLALLLLPALAAAEPRPWTLQKGTGRARFRVEAPLDAIEGSSSGLSGELRLDEATWAEGAGKIHISLTGFTTGLTLRDEDLRDQFFQVDRFPEAVLTLTRLERPSQGVLVPGREAQADAVGTLSLHGKERPVRIPIWVLLSDERRPPQPPGHRQLRRPLHRVRHPSTRPALPQARHRRPRPLRGHLPRQPSRHGPCRPRRPSARPDRRPQPPAPRRALGQRRPPPREAEGTAPRHELGVLPHLARGPRRAALP